MKISGLTLHPSFQLLVSFCDMSSYVIGKLMATFSLIMLWVVGFEQNTITTLKENG